jgi:hypothetical protein
MMSSIRRMRLRGLRKPAPRAPAEPLAGNPRALAAALAMVERQAALSRAWSERRESRSEWDANRQFQESTGGDK